jgi:hypothetical protein
MVGDECTFIPGSRIGLADEAGPYQTRRAVSRFMGPLNRMAVIRRYISNTLN